MDPNATLRRFLDACRDGDTDDAMEAIGDLHDWIVAGGFLPADPRKEG